MFGISKIGLISTVVLILLWVITEILFLDIFGFGRFSTRRQFPSVAKRMGLAAESEWSWHVFPDFSGIYKGYPVLISHESASIQVTMQSNARLSLNTFGNRKNHDTGNSFLDRFFTERMIPECLKNALTENSELTTTIERVTRKWQFKMRRIDIETEYIKIIMKFGNGSYIPASIAEPLTMDLISVAELIEKSCPQTEGMP